MQCLVTGGAGFIGSHLASRLIEDGHSVRVFDNLSTGSRENLGHLLAGSFQFIEGDVRDTNALADAVTGCDVVFHQAALASVPMSIERPGDSHAVCATGTLNVLDAARKAGVRRVVYAASSSAYGNRPEMPKREDHPLEALSPYAAVKLAGELYCESFANSYDLETVRLRYFNVFGPRQDPASPYSAVIPLFASALVEGRQPTIFGDGLQSRDFVYVGNVVDANVKAATVEGVSGQVFNIGCGSAINLLELLEAIGEELGITPDPTFAPPRAGDVKHSWADITAAREQLGYDAAIDWRTGLTPTLDFYRNAANSASASPPQPLPTDR